MKNTFFSLLVIFCLMSTIAHGITYYISPLGNDAYSGTSPSAPWKTISKVNSKDFRSDTILFKAGSTFYGKLYFTSTDIGTSLKPIVIGSYGTGKGIINSGTSYGIYIYNAAGFLIKDLIFTGVNRLTNTESGISIYMDKAYTKLPYLKIDNVEVYGYRKAGISIGSWTTAGGFKDITITRSSLHDNGIAGVETYAMQAYTHRNLYLGYNKVYNNSGISGYTAVSGSGIVLGDVDVALVEYCTVYNNGWLHNYAYTGGPVGIWAYRSDSVTYQFNESHHNKTGTNKDGAGFNFDGGCTNSVMQYNYSHDNYGGGFIIVGFSGAPVMKNIIVRYNISENDGRWGDQGSIHLGAPTNSGGIQTVKIYNNTFFVKPSSGAAPKAFFIRAGPLSDIKLWNNVFQTTGGVPLVQVPYNTSSCLLQGNSYWSSGSTFKIIWGTTTYSSLTAWRTATGQEKVNGSASGLQADAQFADTTTGVTFNDPTKLTTLKRYKLKSTSALINKGLNLKTLFNVNVGSRDYWGNSLVNKTTFHIGAFQGTPVTTTTPTSVTTSISVRSDHLPQDFQENILQVLSNQGQNNLKINITSVKRGRASIALYNSQGQFLRSIFSGDLNAGENKQLIMDTDQLPNGIYLVCMQIGGELLAQKILINRY